MLNTISRTESMRQWLLPGADEWFRGIYTRAGVAAPEVLVICSAISGEGKTTVGIGLAVTLATDFPDRRVLVVEADLERQVLAEDFALEPGPGLVGCLTRGESPQAACRPTALPNLDILPAGGPVDYPGRVLRSSRLPTLLDSLRDSYDLVVVDTPALLVNSDAQLLADLGDGVVLVVRAGVTPTHLVTRALEQVDGTRLRGVVLNATRSSIPSWMRRLSGAA
jgi:capsular exopolysaccharide synthesis family protein